MDDRKQFANWCYEPSGSHHSQQAVRSLFLTRLSPLKPDVPLALFRTVFPGFLALLADRFKNDFERAPEDLKAEAMRNPSFGTALSLCRAIPEIRIRNTFRSWKAVQRLRSSRPFRQQVSAWGKSNNMEAEWCYDHALKVLCEWLYDEGVSWIDDPAFHSHAHHLVDRCWQRVAQTESHRILASRYKLQIRVYSDPLYRPFSMFSFPYECTQKETRGRQAILREFKHSGWAFLDQTKTEWQRVVTAQFKKTIARQKLTKILPVGIHRHFENAVLEYLERTDSAREELADKDHHNLTESRRFYDHDHYPDDYIEWLIQYQIPPTQAYKQIVLRPELQGLPSESIRKYSMMTCRLIGLVPRNPKQHVGRRRGTKMRRVGSATHPREIADNSDQNSL